MTATAIGAVGLVFLFLFLALRMTVALAMMVVGFFGTIAINGLPAAMSTLGWRGFRNFDDRGPDRGAFVYPDG